MPRFLLTTTVDALQKCIHTAKQGVISTQDRTMTPPATSDRTMTVYLLRLYKTLPPLDLLHCFFSSELFLSQIFSYSVHQDSHRTMAPSATSAPSSVLSATPRRLEGKVALITGGSSGIGECTVKLFVEHGAKVAIADIQDKAGQSLAQTLGSSNCIYIHCDVTNEDHIKNAVDKTVETFGKLDIMFNNAGIIDVIKPTIMENEKSDFERVMSVNTTGVFLGMKHAVRVMAPLRSGSIISTASNCSGIGGYSSHAYTCSKHAVLGLTRSLASEVGQIGIRVNCISPYSIATPLSMGAMKLEFEEYRKTIDSVSNLKGTTLETDDVAKAALYFASDDSKFVSGHNLFIDGGLSVCTSVFNYFKHPES